MTYKGIKKELEGKKIVSVAASKEQTFGDHSICVDDGEDLKIELNDGSVVKFSTFDGHVGWVDHGRLVEVEGRLTREFTPMDRFDDEEEDEDETLEKFECPDCDFETTSAFDLCIHIKEEEHGNKILQFYADFAPLVGFGEIISKLDTEPKEQKT